MFKKCIFINEKVSFFESKLVQNDSVYMHRLINLLEYRYEALPAGITADLEKGSIPKPSFLL